MSPSETAATRRSIAFLNWAHAIDHYVMLIFPTVVIGLEAVYGRPYSELIALGSASFIAFNGVCGNLGAALAAGITAALASAFSWRAAFLVPAALCVATGIYYVLRV